MTNLTTTPPEYQIKNAFIASIARFDRIERFKEVITEVAFEYVMSNNFSNMHPIGEQNISYLLQLHTFLKEVQQIEFNE